MTRPQATPADGFFEWSVVAVCRWCRKDIRRDPENPKLPGWYHQTYPSKGKAVDCARKHLAQRFHQLVARCKETAANMETRKHRDGYYMDDLVSDRIAKADLVAFCMEAEDMILNGYAGT